MAGRSRHDADSALAAALARGEKVEDAAKQAGISARTAFRRLQDHDFARLVAEARTQMVRRVGGRLADAGDRAVTTLVGLLDDDKAKLGAAKAIIEFMFKSSELVELQAQFEELRRRVAEVVTNGERDRTAAAGRAANGLPPGTWR